MAAESDAVMELPQWAGFLKRKDASDGEEEEEVGGVGSQKRKGAKVAETAREVAAVGGRGSLERLVALLGQLVLINTRELSDLTGTVYHTFMVPEGSALVKDGLAAGKAYNAQIEKLRQEKKEDDDVDLAQLGPPYLVIFVAVVVGMLRRARAAAVEEPIAVLERAMVRINSTPQVDLVREIRYFRFKPARGVQSKKMSGRVKFAFYFDVARSTLAKEVEALLIDELSKVNSMRMAGAAPRGQLERDAQKLLDQMQKGRSGGGKGARGSKD